MKYVFAALLLFMVGCSMVGSDPVTINQQFAYTATGDDGIVGQASLTQIRAALSADDLINDWDNCLIINEHTPWISQVRDSLSVDVIVNTGIDYYFATKIADEVQPFRSGAHWHIDSTVIPWDTTALTPQGRNWSMLSNIITRNYPDVTAPSPIGDFDFAN